MNAEAVMPREPPGDHGVEHEIFSFGPFKLFPAKRSLERSGQAVKLGGRAFDILVLLVRHASKVVTQREIHAAVWSGLIVDEGSLRFHVSALRKALGDGQPDVKYVVNVPGRGYCFVASITCLRTASSAPRPGSYTRKAVPSSLPPALVRMVGRSETVRDIGVKLLAEHFVTIVGPGGMGKTTVAVALAHTVLADFSSEVQYVDLGSVRQAGQVAAAVAIATGLQVVSDDPIPSILEALRTRHMLLILDSCEHVLDAAAPLIEQIVAQSPEVFILATSREPLRAEGEHVFRLPPLRMPPEGISVTEQELLEYSAPQLFLERARAGGAQIELNPADVEAVIEICRKLDGMALAIELAAGRVQAYGIHKTAALLGHQFSLLWPGRRTALPRHQTLAATLDWSYNLLSPAERRLLYRLAVFIGTFDLEAINAVAGKDAGTPEWGDGADISSLVSKSLAISEPTGGEARYRLLDTTRSYGLKKLAESGEQRLVAEQHARHYEKVLIRYAEIEQMTGEWPRALASSINDIRAAMSWTVSGEGNATLTGRLAASSASLWLGMGLLPECRDRMMQAAEVAERSEATAEEKILIQMALGAAVMFTIGLGEEFRTSWTKVLSLAEEVGNVPRQLTAHLTLWAQQIRGFNMNAALELAQRCAAVANEFDHAGPKSMALWMLGLSEHHLGQYESSRRHLEEALTSEDEADRMLQLRHFGYDRRTDGLGVLSNALWMQGHTADALEMSSLAVAEARQLDHPIPLCVALAWHCFNLYVIGAEWNEIERQSTLLANHAQRHGIETYQGIGICLQALAGKPGVPPEETASAVARGIKMLNRGQYVALNPIFQAEAAMVLAGAGLLVHGEALFAAMMSEERNPDHWCSPEIARIRGELALCHGRTDEAEHWFRASIDWAARHGSLAWQLRSSNSLATLLIAQERPELVGDLLAPLLDRFSMGVVSRDVQKARGLLESQAPGSSSHWPPRSPNAA